MADCDENNSVCMLEKFRVKIDEMPDSPARTSLKQAVDSFGRFLVSVESPGDLDEALASDWVAWMFASGYSYKTAAYYVNRLSALYNKVCEGDCFSAIKEKLKGASKASIEVNSVEDCFGKLRALAMAPSAANPRRQLGRDLVLFSLYNGGLSFDRLAKYKKDDYQGDDEAIRAIVARNARPKNKYLFPLRQSELTPRQLRLEMSSLFAEALKSVGIRLSEYTSGTAVDLWAVAAMRCGFSASDIAGCLGVANGVNPLYSFAAKSELSAERRAEIRSRVASVLAKDPEDWFAMQFRPYVDYNKLQARFDVLGISLPKTFYPMEEIVRRVGKKMRRESRPVMPGLMFFKARATTLPGLFAGIGDLAWGYRYARGPRAPYAVIPQAAIDDYQRAIGQFADAIDAHPAGTLSLAPGTPVEILAGPYAGHPAIFERELRLPPAAAKAGACKPEGTPAASGGAADAPRLIARLRLTGLPTLTWTVDIDPRLLAPSRLSLA